MDMHKEILTIFDADFIPFTATMGNKIFDDEGNPLKEDGRFVYIPKTEEQVYQSADELISLILDKTDANYYSGYIGGCKSFRYEVYPEYKGTRKRTGFPDYYKELREYLVKQWGFIETLDGLEADDAVNIVRNNFKNEYNCIIVSSDKDLTKSTAGTYLVPRNMSDLVVTTEEEAKIHFWTSMITGDTIDNIKGVEGRGIKYAETIFSRENTLYYDDVLWAYIKQYGECNGVEQFYKNYKCLHILEEFSNFVMPELISWQSRTKWTLENFGSTQLEGI